MKEYLPIGIVAGALLLLARKARADAAGGAKPVKNTKPELPKNNGITAGPKAGASVQSISPQNVANTLDSLIYYAP